MNTNGLINRGNLNRIKKVMKRARGGEPVSAVYLGGSITQGSLSSTQDKCYASRVNKWWVDKFPNSEITFINAGIGGTTSQFGVSRVKNHVLRHRPDFILTEFAVNDDDTDFFMETYEGLIRKILKDADRPTLMLMNNAWFDSGNNSERIHLAIAKHYELPMVSMKSTIWPAIESGELVKENLSPDMLHPNDEGHKLVSEVIIDFLEKVYESMDEDEAPLPYDVDMTKVIELPEPFTDNKYEYSKRIKKYDLDEYDVKLDGFLVDTHKKKEFLDIFSGGFTGAKVGDSITFKAECTGLAVQYKKTIHKPAPIAKAVIDGDESNPVVLDANFTEDWGDCLYIETCTQNMPLGTHEIKITITEAHEDDQVPFYLVSVIASASSCK